MYTRKDVLEMAKELEFHLDGTYEVECDFDLNALIFTNRRDPDDEFSYTCDDMLGMYTHLCGMLNGIFLYTRSNEKED